jgi:hypothetical protein
MASLATRQDRALKDVREIANALEENTLRLRALRLARDAETAARNKRISDFTIPGAAKKKAPARARVHKPAR